MRINRYLASATGLGRRLTDKLINEGRVKVDGQIALIGQDINEGQKVTLDEKLLALPTSSTSILLNKPVGYVVSRKGQGASTIYSLLPKKYHRLKPVGRLDKNSSGLLLLSNDGKMTQELAHPSFNKQKVYEVKVNKKLSSKDLNLVKKGIELEDGVSKMAVMKTDGDFLVVSLSEGRNRQIRRTFQAIGYRVVNLKRVRFGSYGIDDLKPGQFKEIA